MKLWTVHYPSLIDYNRVNIDWCATQIDAKQLKAKVHLEQKIKHSEIVIQPVDVPIRKAELVSWLNEHDVKA